MEKKSRLGLGRLASLLEKLKRTLDLSSTTLSNVTLNSPTLSGTVTGMTPEGTAVKSTGESGGSKFLREDGDGSCSWQDATPEGTAIKSTGESGGSKFLREDGDGSCSWQDVDATSKFTIPIVGFGNNYTEDAYYGRDPGDTLDQKWDYSLGTSVGAESYVVACRTANFVATSACKVTKLRGWAFPSGHSESIEFDIWKATPTNASSSNVTYTQIGSASTFSADTANKAYSLSTTYSSGNTFSAGDVLLFTVRKTSGGNGNDAVYFTITLEFEFT